MLYLHKGMLVPLGSQPPTPHPPATGMVSDTLGIRGDFAQKEKY